MKKIIALLTISLIGLYCYSQEGGIRTLKTISKETYFLDQTGTYNRLLLVQPNGRISSIANGSGILLNNGLGGFSYMGKPWNYTVQPLSGTTITWNVDSGLGATITLSGNTSITLTNLQVGMSGVIFVTNPASVYKLKFVGYTCILGRSITYDSTGMTCSGSSKYDSFGWSYTGGYLWIHGNFNYNIISW